MGAATSTETQRIGTPVVSPADRPRWVDVLALTLLALVVRLPSYVADRALTFDDAVFANSALAMRDGGVPFRDVFSSQGPLFLPMVALGDLLGLRTLDSPRVLAVLSGVAAVLATYWAALALTDRIGALMAGALLATSGTLAWVTGPLAADGPALAFAALTMGLALRHRDRPTTARAALMGAALGAALSTKSLEAPILVPVALVLLAPFLSAARRRTLARTALWHGVVAAGASVAVFLVVSVPLGLAEVWDQSVVYRSDAAADRDIGANAVKLVTTLWDRDLAVLFIGAVALVCGVLARRRTGSARVVAIDEDVDWASQRRWSPGADADWSPSGRLLVVSWLALTVVWLVVVVSPLWRPHVAAVSIPLVLVIATYRPPVRPLLAAAALAIPLVVVQLDGLLVTGPYRGTEAQLVAALRELPDGGWVISDEPGVVWRAGRRTTDDLVDPSMLRREQGRYTATSLVDAAADPRVCAFIRNSDERFGHFDELPGLLTDAGFAADPEVGSGDVLYVRTDCDPPT